ncbi:MAG TPA: hypothetical protein VNZ26_23795 [Vicinamibacterales bacterium]|jgi:hypothetical protein|nr:hypothetical protein [Vicinamibacterales bacterium]
MRTTAFLIATIGVIAASGSLSLPVAGQEKEKKPVPKDSVRVAIPGCTKGYMFTAGPRTLDEPGNFEIPEGMHLRMNAPKKLMAEIKGQEGSMIEITGVMKKGQYKEGINIGSGIRISPGPAPNSGTMMGAPVTYTPLIDVEGWRPSTGFCPSR